MRYDLSDRNGPKNHQDQSAPIGPSAHWSAIRRHAQSDVLANKARNYILQMLQQDHKNPPR